MSKRKNKKNKEERLENAFDVFMRNYRNVPGFKILVKLSLPFLLCLFIIVVVAVGNPNTKMPIETTTKVETDNKLSYKELLDNVYLNDIKYDINIKILDTIYQLKVTNENNVLTGFLEDINGIKQFKINEDRIYEIKMNNELENENLFDNFDMKYIKPKDLILYIQSLTASTKSIIDGNIQYNYNLEDGQIHVITNDEKVLSISINENDFSYDIVFK